MDDSVFGVVYGMALFLAGVLIGRLWKSKAAPAGDTEGTIEIYVGNLSYEVSERDLTKYFGQFGEVASSRIIKNRFNGKSKGYGFVLMRSRNSASSAIRELNGKDIKGRRVVVNEAKSSQRSGEEE